MVSWKNFFNERVRRMKQALLVGGLLLVFLVAGCSKNSGKGGGGGLGTAEERVAGVTWKVPARWTRGSEKPMRTATYIVPPLEGKGESAECAVSFFGSGQGGMVEANVDRWVGQFENPVPPAKSEREINGLKVTTVQISGTYLGMGGMGMESSPKKENYRLLGAIVEAPEGMVFFKLTGPNQTVEGAEKEFDAMVGSLAK